MRILYKQPEEQQPPVLGISNCYFKQLWQAMDKRVTTLNPHHHTDYEVHILQSGMQAYEIGGDVAELQAGMFLIIPPYEKHRVLAASEDMQKASLTFHSEYTPGYSHFVGEVTPRVEDNLRFIAEEAAAPTGYSRQLIGNRVFETILLLLRLGGYREQPAAEVPAGREDERLTLARQYVQDNVQQNISAGDVAYYCHLSTRQLTRIFLEEEGISLSRYIHNEKMKALQQEVLTSGLTLREISEKYSYSSEYYFNKAFKKSCGMTPGAYRRLYVQNEQVSLVHTLKK